MSIVLPSELRYSESLPTLPTNVQSMEQCLLPVNGQNFALSTGGQVQWDLPARGYLVPDSMYIKYKGAVSYSTAQIAAQAVLATAAATAATAVTTANTAFTTTPSFANLTAITTANTANAAAQAAAQLVAKMRGTPVYTPIQKLETIFGSQVVESINNYGQIQNMITNCTLNVAQKAGLQSGYGYKSDTSGLLATQCPTLQSLDGRMCNGAETTSYSAPLPCLLSNAEKLVPLGMMPTVRIQLTLDTINNIFTTAALGPYVAANPVAGILAESPAIIPNDYTLSDFQLCYTMVDFGPETDAAVRSMGDTLRLKSQSFTNSALSVTGGTNGTIELSFSQRLASVKSVFLHSSCASANGSFESFDISSGGDYQFSIAGKYYPPKPINAGGNKSGVLMELKKAMGSIYDKNNSFSIDTNEFNMVIGTASTPANPAKCFIGCNTEILPSNGVILSGVSTQSSPITARINFVAATPATTTSAVALIACYDAIIEVIPAEKSAVVRQ